MDRLLTRQADALPIYNRYDIARELGNVDQALSMAFAGMSAQDDEPLYDRFRQHAPAQASYLQIGGQVHRQGALDSHALQFETRLVINSRLQLVLNWSRQQPTSTDPLLSGLAPSVDQLGSAKIQWQGPRGATSLTLLRRSGQTDLTGFRLTQSHQWSGRLTLDAGLNFRVDSTASQPLRLAGYESSIFGSLNYALGKREYVRVAPRFSRYETQWGDLLGSGQALDLEVGYRFRTEYPDWRVRTFASWQRFSSATTLSAESLARLPVAVQSAIANNALDPVAYFMPTGNVVWGACLGMGDNLGGQNLQETYSRAWRAFGDLCFNHNTSSVSGVLGIAGSVSGEDHLLLQWQSSDGTGSGGAPANTLLARYRRYF